MQTNIKKFADIKGSAKESTITINYSGGKKPSEDLGMLDGWKAPMFSAGIGTKL